MQRSGGANSKPMYLVCPAHVQTLDEAIEDVQVHGPGTWENELSNSPLLKDWYAVSTGDYGIVAYFGDENEALSYRLKIIDRWLNG